MVEVGWKASRLLRHECAAPVAAWDGFDGARAISAQLEDLLQSIRTGTPARATFADAMANVDAIAAAYRALEARCTALEA